MSRYQEVADDLLRRISEGEFPVGAQLPGISALQEHYEVSGLNTIRAAQQRLVEEGMLRTQQGVGAFVIAAEPRRAIDVAETSLGGRRKRTFTLYDGVPPADATVVPLPELDTYTRAQLFLLTVTDLDGTEVNQRNADSTQVYVQEGAALADGRPIGHTRELWRYETTKELYRPQWVALPEILGPVADLVIYRPYDGPTSSPVPYRVTAVLTAC